jgi:hypothetical protein
MEFNKKLSTRSDRLLTPCPMLAPYGTVFDSMEPDNLTKATKLTNTTPVSVEKQRKSFISMKIECE